MDSLILRAAQLIADPGESMLVAINMLAALIIVGRAFRRLSSMCCCTPHGMRLGAILMAAGAVAVLLAAFEGSIPLSWPQTILLGGVATHCLFDRRAAPRLGEPQRAISAAANEAGA